MKKFYILLIAMFLVNGAKAQWTPLSSGTNGYLESFESRVMSQESHLSILNLSGQELIKKTVSGSKTTIDITNLNPGLYIVILIGEQGVCVGKIVKE